MATEIELEEELRRIDRELNGPKIPEKEQPARKPKKSEPPPWAAEQLLPRD